jgi:hypothetical protein
MRTLGKVFRKSYCRGLRTSSNASRRHAQRHPAAKSAADRFQCSFRHLNPDCEIPGSGCLVPGAIHCSIRACVAMLS